MKKILKSLLYIIVGNLFYALAFNLFLVNNGIAAGGFAGIATLINHFVKVPVGLTVLIMNIPLIVWAWKTKGRAYALRCIVGNLVFTIITDSTAILPTLTYNKIFAAIGGGLLYGCGVYIMVIAKAAAGGTDLLSRLMIQLKLFDKITVGKMIFYLDGAVVIATAFVYGNIMQAIYTLLGILVYSKMSDFLINMHNRKKILKEEDFNGKDI